MLRRPKLSTIDKLHEKAAAAHAAADAADAAVKRAEFASIAQDIVSKRADKLEALIAEHDGWDAQRLSISAKVGEASRNVWSLNDKLTNARTAVDAALAAGDTDKAAEHGLAVGALSLTLARAQQTLADIQSSFDAVPHGSVDDIDRKNAVEFRAISKSAARSAEVLSLEVQRTNGGELRELGRMAHQYPGLLRTTTSPVIDNRVPA